MTKRSLIFGICLFAIQMGCLAQANPNAAPPAFDPVFITVDQFGYLPKAEKIAVLRDPRQGYDAAQSYAPSETLSVISETSGKAVFTAAPLIWNAGKTHKGSGDVAWHFDFSGVTTPGRYYISDAKGRARSASFFIAPNVYRPVFVEAVRNLYYQRAGFAKTPPFIDAAWADGPSHLGAGQDGQARRFLDKDNADLTRDMQGGWYDAGDYNQYSNWTANYIVSLLLTYQERPAIFTDDFNIPESGNGVPDLLDEVRWGTQWLARMQNSDGSVHAILSRADGSPPSSATGPSFYGDVNSSATLTAASAFAISAKVFDAEPALAGLAKNYARRAKQAWVWAEKNPNIVFKNNDEASGTQGLGAGQQEVDTATLRRKKLKAAIHLFALTGERQYSDFVAKNLDDYPVIKTGFVSPFDGDDAQDLLYFAGLDSAPKALRARILSVFTAGIKAEHMLGAVASRQDPYGAPILSYTWGSNSVKARQGAILTHPALKAAANAVPAELARAAGAGYLHALHGVNPLGLVYLSNMERFGATRSVDTFYHTWFKHGSADYDSVSQSRFGPAPGYLVGGPNPFYNRAACCPKSCGPEGNSMCKSAPFIPPFGQPDQKSYGEFNEGWPYNSWEVTENSLGYQTAYIALLARYIDPRED